MNPIDKIPDFDWTDQARKEIGLAGQLLLEQSELSYSVGNVLICGLIYQNFLSPPWFWFALAKGVTLRHLIDFRRLQDFIPQGTLTAVEADFTEGLRFAKFYGFEDAGQVEVRGNITYNIFRRA